MHSASKQQTEYWRDFISSSLFSLHRSRKSAQSRRWGCLHSVDCHMVDCQGKSCFLLTEPHFLVGGGNRLSLSPPLLSPDDAYPSLITLSGVNFFTEYDIGCSDLPGPDLRSFRGAALKVHLSLGTLVPPPTCSLQLSHPLPHVPLAPLATT